MSKLFVHTRDVKCAFIPKNLQGILWSVNVNKLDIEKDKEYIIHQILMFGTLKEIRWLIHTYGLETVKKTFQKSPAKIYSPAAFHFIKNLLLGLRRKRLDASRYVVQSNI